MNLVENRLDFIFRFKIDSIFAGGKIDLIFVCNKLKNRLDFVLSVNRHSYPAEFVAFLHGSKRVLNKKILLGFFSKVNFMHTLARLG